MKAQFTCDNKDEAVLDYFKIKQPEIKLLHKLFGSLTEKMLDDMHFTQEEQGLLWNMYYSMD
jgi:hypothetical protein